MQLKLVSAAAIAALFTVAPARGAADLVDIANAVRSQGCAELPAVDRPLRSRAPLEEAARRLAQGDGLEKATSESGYRAKKTASIRIRTADGDSDVAQILAQRFCDIVADKSLRDIGAFRRGDRIWMVLATPLSPPDHQDAQTAARRVLELINAARAHPRRCGREKFQATK
ncbi:MAG: hypothetical protein WD448_09830, partial [Woeseia sp.]